MSSEKNTVGRKFIRTLSEYHMLSGKSSVLVGFSGGSDSALLLTLLSEIPGIQVYAAHLNHMIRGEEADRDERFCRDFCIKCGIPIFVLKTDIPRLSAERGTGLEETARNERYSFFSRISEKNRIDCIATAHNSSDNAETILFNLIRGCGTNGLCGIPPIRDNIIRPLILCSKEEILAECERRGIEYVYDSTNADTDYTRNFIRHRIIPSIKNLNPAFEKTVSETAYLLRTDKAYFSASTESFSLSSGRTLLSSLDDALLGRVLLREFRAAGLSPGYEHIRSAIKLIRSHTARFSLSMPSGTFVCDRNELFLESEESKIDPIKKTPLIPGINILSEDTAVLLNDNSADFSKDINKLKNIYKLSIHTSIDSAKINDVIFARKRQPDDSYVFGGMTRNVKKLLQSRKMTLKERLNLPVFALKDQIIWIPGFPTGDFCKPSEKSSVTELFYFSKKIKMDNSERNNIINGNEEY